MFFYTCIKLNLLSVTLDVMWLAYLQLFEIISTCLGFPPDSVEYDFYDKDKKYHKIGPISPQEYYETSVKPHFDMSQQVSGHQVVRLINFS